METKRINFMLSIFGDYGNLLNQMPEVAKNFNDFEKNFFQETNPNNPNPGFVYQLKNQKIQVTVRSFRIDVDYIENTNLDIDLKIGTDVLYRFIPFDDLLTNRISINTVRFIEDSLDTYTKKMTEVLGLYELFGKSRELMIRYNSESQVKDIEINDILSINSGMVQDKKAFTNTKSLIFAFDVNSVVKKEYEGKFKVNNLLSYYEQMKEIIQTKLDKLTFSLENVDIEN